MGEFARTVREEIRRSTGPMRKAVDGEFAELDAALRAAADRAAATRGDATDAGAALLARLRAELGAAAE
jgi:hypothetical protein